MESKVMMVLGGYSGAGILISRLLLQETRINLILAGRDYVKANKTAEKFNAEFDGNCVQGMQMDASNNKGLKEAFKNCDNDSYYIYGNWRWYCPSCI